ncbi:MAG: DNA polymerase III subunit delta' [Rhodospirillaceae bacterium]|nr:DNA polymerase III subunit delta' [Rhodospirillaceae bacterium]
MSEPEIKRPEETLRLFGQDAAQAVLSTAWWSGKLANAWLLCGAEGIGKATLAFRFTRTFLGGAPDVAGNPPLPGMSAVPLLSDGDPSDQVSRNIASGAHPNLRVIRRSVNPKSGKTRSEIVVDDVQDAKEQFLTRTATDGGWRILIIDPADDLNASAANALLKILEEPPYKALFLLVNHRHGAVIPTIRSRCQSVVLSVLADTDVRYAAEEAAPVLAGKANNVVWELSMGSPGRALRLLEAGAADLDRRVSAILDGSEDRSRVDALDLAEAVARSDQAASYRIVGDLLGHRIAAVARETSVACHRRDAAILWSELDHRFRQAEALNLDRRHVVYYSAISTRDLLRRPSTP